MRTRHSLPALVIGAAFALLGCMNRAPIPQTPSPLSSAPSDVIRIETGELQGRIEDGVEVYRGVPYAQPPVGVLRWRPPQRVAVWAGVRPAETFANVCMQADAPYDPNWSPQPTSEDCLYLNVWTTTRHAPARAPVMVWIHGGGYMLGAGNGPGFDGAALARRGVVLVTFNYRLGRFGFFAHPALTSEAHGAPIGNYGLMDQIAALEWVKRNIAAFGGDPNNVTLFGESAGGRSVNLLLTSPAAQGLIQKAIVESGGERGAFALLSQNRPDLPSAESIGVAFARSAGVTTDDPATLRAIPADRIVDGLSFISPQNDRFSGAFIDGQIIVAEPYLTFRSDRLPAIPYMIGYNDGEFAGLPFIGFMSDAGLRTYGADAAGVRALYGRGDATYHRYFANESFFEEPARRFAGAIAARGAPAYIYRFSYIAEADRERIRTGAPHTSEIPYVFDTVSAFLPNATAADRAQGALVADYWVSFARSGDPNAQGRPTWPRYNAQSSELLEFTNSGPVARTHQNIDRLDYLSAHLPDQRFSWPR